MYKNHITEEAWRKIYSFLSGIKEVYCKNEVKTKKFFDGVFWIMRTGAQWRELPEKFGKWNSVFYRFSAWSSKYIWDRLMGFCANDPDLEWIVIDATIVRAHACAAGYKKDSQEQECLGRSKGGFTTKIHVKTEALGLPLKVTFTPGNRNDITQASALIKGSKDTDCIADKAYDADAFRDQLKDQNCTATIPPRANRKKPASYDEHRYVERHVIECFFSKIKQFRRIFSRYDKSIRNFASFVALAGACIWLR